jgi:streptogramin lyase
MTTYPSTTRSLLSVLSASTFALMLSGCAGLGINPVTVNPVTTVAAGKITGTVFGGQQPVIGASIQLYTMNPTTLRGASTALLPTGAVTTNSSGGFNVTVSYTCPTGDYVYIVATGGDAGGGTNNNLAMMAGLGPCSATYTRISINELSTVASAYALGPYMSDYLHAGYAGGTVIGLTGINNAFAMLNSLVNISTGSYPGPTAPANATMPVNQLTTVADIIASCVNTNTVGGTCSTLFSNAVNGSGGQPTNTIDAAINIAHLPGQNVGPLYGLIPTQQPYPTGTTGPPADFTVPIKLTGGSLATPYGVAIDSTGNAWVTNESGTAVSEFSPTGTALSGSSGVTFNGAQGLTIDPAGNVWVANTGGNNLIEIASTGAYVRTATSSYLNAPVDVAADARNNIWEVNFLPVSGPGYLLNEFNSSGAILAELTGGSTVNAPYALAIDPTGNVWTSNSGTGTLTVYNKSAAQVSPAAGYTDNALQGNAGIAFDSTGNAWVLGQGGPELSGFSAAGASLASTPVYAVNGAALAQPTGVAVDGANNIWVTNNTGSGYLSEFAASTGAPVANAKTLGTLNSPVQLAVDPSGNVWTANSGDSSITVFVGLAAPTTTPLVARTQ